MSARLEIPEDLLDSVARRQCLLFVGPWASLAPPKRVGPPGPNTLAAQLAHRLKRLPEDMSLPWVAQLYQDTIGQRELDYYVARQMKNRDYRPTVLQQQIATLSFPIIVDTALDPLLQELLRRFGEPEHELVIEDVDITLVDGPIVVKLYGTADRAATMRITEDSRRNLPNDQPGIINYITAQMATMAQLFVGHRKSHPSFKFLYRLLRENGHNKNLPAAYIVEPGSTPELEKGYWSKRKLQMIDGNPIAFMDELCRKLAEREALSEIPPAEAQMPRFMTPAELDEIKSVFDFILEHAGVKDAVESGVHLQNAAHNQHYIGALWSEVGPSMDQKPTQVDLQLAHAAWASKEIEEACDLFHEALEQDPDQIDARFSLHTLLAEQGKLDESLEQYQLAVERDPRRRLLPDRYELKAVLGVGNLGIAYKALDTRTGKLLSVMLLHSIFSRESRAVKLANFEADVSRLHHPRIPSLEQCGHHRGRRFIARDYVAGQVLAHYPAGDPSPIDQPQPDVQVLPVAEALSILGQVSEAVAYAHEQGVLHLGLNPYTVIITPDKSAMVVDFGEANLVSDQFYMTETHIEAADYLAPEQLSGKVVDQRSDVYSIGILAYKLLTGRPLGSGSIELISEINPDADDALDLFVGKAVAFDPGQRFASAADMRDELRRLVVMRDHGAGRHLMIVVQRGLRYVSRFMAAISAWPRWLGLVALLLVAGVLDNLLDPRYEIIHLVSRLTPLIILGTVPTSLLCYWRIREIARVTGMGSLVHGARGIGAVFGLLMSLLVVWKSAHVPGAQQGWDNLMGLATHPESGPLPFAFATIVGFVTFGMAYVMLLVATIGGRVAQRRWNNFPGGFYLTFLFVIIALVVLLLSPWLFGFITPGDSTSAPGATPAT